MNIQEIAAKAEFDLGDMVYSRVGDQAPGIIIEALIAPRGICYNVAWGKGTEAMHYDFEISKERMPENL